MFKKDEKGIAHLLLIAVLAVFAVGGTATVYAADSSKPGDALYSVDRAVEGVQGSLAFGDQAYAEHKLDLATERLEELQTLNDEGADTELIDEASGNYGQAISEAANALAEAAKSGEGFDEAKATLLTEATQVHLDVLAKVHEQVPEEAKEAVEGAMEKSEKGAEKALEALNGDVSAEQKEAVKEKIEESKNRRGMPDSIPNGSEEGSDASDDGADASNQGGSNAPANAGRP